MLLLGRTNVGKSSLFNRLVGKKLSLVNETEHTTRDYLSATAKAVNLIYTLIDGGGVTHRPSDPFHDQVNQQVYGLIQSVDLILFVCDGQSGLHPHDEVIADALRTHQQKVILVINKIDSADQAVLGDDFYRLGFQHLVKVSASHRLGIADLNESIKSRLPEIMELPPSIHFQFSICIIGEPNSGKSSYFNALLNEDRMFVSDIPGTTRDVVSELLTFQKQNILIRDTAGIRPKTTIKDTTTYFSMARARKSIQESEVCLLVCDATKGIGRVTKQILDIVRDAKKPCVLVMNKWDLVKGVEQARYANHIFQRLPFLRPFEIAFISAKTKRSITHPLLAAQTAHANYRRSIKTKTLNDFLFELKNNHPFKENIKLKYLTQIKTAPPSFLLVGRRVKQLKNESSMFIKNQIQQQFKFVGTPIELFIREEEVK